MTNYHAPGDVMTYTAGGTITKGTGLLVGGILAIPTVSVGTGDQYTAVVKGVVEHAKTSAQAWTEGAKIYWSAGSSVMTTSAGGNTLVGTAARVADNPSATGFVRLDGVAR